MIIGTDSRRLLGCSSGLFGSTRARALSGGVAVLWLCVAGAGPEVMTQGSGLAKA